LFNILQLQSVVYEVYFSRSIKQTDFQILFLIEGHWQDVNNQKQFFQRLSEELGIEELSDWYRVSRREVRRRGGWSLFTYYPSLGHALKANYPDYSWEPARFIEEGTAPHGFWQNKTNLLDALNRTEAKLGIEKVIISKFAVLSKLFGLHLIH